LPELCQDHVSLLPLLLYRRSFSTPGCNRQKHITWAGRLLPSRVKQKSLQQQVAYSATTDQIHVQHKEPKNEYQHSYLHWNFTILTRWRCLSVANHILCYHSVHDGNAFVSNALLLAQGSSLFFFSKRMLHWRRQCSIVSEWRYPTRVGYLNVPLLLQEQGAHVSTNSPNMSRHPSQQPFSLVSQYPPL
jgi:hypothetical protein